MFLKILANITNELNELLNRHHQSLEQQKNSSTKPATDQMNKNVENYNTSQFNNNNNIPIIATTLSINNNINNKETSPLITPKKRNFIPQIFPSSSSTSSTLTTTAISSPLKLNQNFDNKFTQLNGNINEEDMNAEGIRDDVPSNEFSGSVQEMIEHFQQFGKRISANKEQNANITSPLVNTQNNPTNSSCIQKSQQTNFAAIAYRPQNTTNSVIIHNNVI